MARYFFDSGDRDVVLKDEVGIECDGIASARHQAIEGLIDLTREFLEDIDGQELFIEIRDEHGEKLVRLSLSLHAQPSGQ
ncbi:hypothetical protein LB553_02510 [Mesorhizobium sp. CA8]|uniref:DUF6894 family protein n=1 Tax=unclassified Mesorhizobium TaxID=325217 RepID=UPI001CCC3A6F|nr:MULTISPECIES: hypothetical protein [unclassified Mesorhizobium]MBZ9759755.1 hypothetical protein [Mesorhizobium sp. CA8]MBZ9819731.1 hypothetical protein [Mesorhizobium sp. CA4]